MWSRLAQEISEKIRNIGHAPSMTPVLNITIFEGIQEIIPFDLISVNGEVDAFGFSLTMRVKKGFEKHMPIFRNHIRVPIARIMNQLQTARISGIGNKKVAVPGRK